MDDWHTRSCGDGRGHGGGGGGNPKGDPRLPGSPRIVSTTVSTRAALRPCTTTVAPTRASPMAVASPMPCADPVTRQM